MLRDADRDDDIVSVTVLSTGPQGDHLRADGAVVVIKGGNYVELFSQWAERNKLLTRGKSIVEPDGVRCTLLAPPAIADDDFTEDDGAVEFYADGEYGTTTVERLTLRIEPRTFDEDDEDAEDAEDLYDFTLRADGELHDGHTTLGGVARSYPNVAPTLDDWKVGRTAPFAVALTAARKLAGMTEPLPEELAHDGSKQGEDRFPDPADS